MIVRTKAQQAEREKAYLREEACALQSTFGYFFVINLPLSISPHLLGGAIWIRRQRKGMIV